MEVEKGKTAKYLKEKHIVPKKVTEQLKQFNRTKKSILNALKEGDKTVPQLAETLNLSTHEMMFQLMSLLKYGLVETGEMDDMDEYFYYKIKSDGKNKS
ncbi:MAG: winged helix-turn-helix transcriptional regulator [Bacteroidales bacterium]|nr:winged helix-turn-helix transcriptional regulator [Bacteroidales bacterium]